MSEKVASYLTVRISEEDKTRLYDAAKTLGVTASEFVRFATKSLVISTRENSDRSALAKAIVVGDRLGEFGR